MVSNTEIFSCHSGRSTLYALSGQKTESLYVIFFIVYHLRQFLPHVLQVKKIPTFSDNSQVQCFHSKKTMDGAVSFDPMHISGIKISAILTLNNLSVKPTLQKLVYIVQFLPLPKLLLNADNSHTHCINVRQYAGAQPDTLPPSHIHVAHTELFLFPGYAEQLVILIKHRYGTDAITRSSPKMSHECSKATSPASPTSKSSSSSSTSSTLL